MNLNNDKLKYQTLCKQNDNIPLFLQYNWVNTLYEHWEISLYYKGDDCYAFMIFPIQKKKGFTLIHIPALSPFQGFFIHYPPGQKTHKRISFEHEVLQYFINDMPKYDWLRQKLPYDFKNFLPFYWNDFTLYPKITYELNLISNSENELWQGLKESLRRNIKKAEKQLTIEESNSISNLYQLKAERKNIEPVNYSLDYLNKIIKAVNNNYILYYAKDENQSIIAGVLVVYDNDKAYYLLGSVKESHKNSGALSLLLWKSIVKCKTLGIFHFNFEGSMLKPIERYFRSFGAEQYVYFEVEKINNPLLKLKKKII
tara:strand:+ start:75659 stop:76597 length:939 start_codon:yes stop_codon:yes gene_type:complete